MSDVLQSGVYLERECWVGGCSSPDFPLLSFWSWSHWQAAALKDAVTCTVIILLSSSLV